MFGLKETTIKRIQSVFSKYSQIEKAVIYGSRAKGNYRNGSDIDISFFGEKLSQSIIFKIEDNLDDLYLPYSFDLSIFDNIDNPKFKEHIERVGKVFYMLNIY
jgi:predicted nucleotidyltransferase